MQRDDRLRHILKAVILLLGIVVSFAFGSDALAHTSRDLGARIPRIAANGSDVEFLNPHAVDRHAESFLEAARSKSIEALGSDRGESLPGPCDYGCCCGPGAHGASCTGAMVDGMSFSQPFFVKERRVRTVSSAAAGMRPIPADPPPRLLV